MKKFTVLAVKNIMLETDIEADSQEEAWKIAQNLNSEKFAELADEHTWKIKTIYHNNEISSI